jgi:LysM repeat protein
MLKIRGLQTLAIAVVMLFPAGMAAQVPVEVSDQKIVSEGKVYFMHEVLKGQTLYSISRAYKVPIDLITGANEISKSGIQAGQVLKIPVSGTLVQAQPVPGAGHSSKETVQPPLVEISDQKIVSYDKVYYMHEVKKGQTLYSIAKAYKVTIIDITRENVIPSSGIYEGQMLKIPATSSHQLTEPDAPAPAKAKEELQAGKERDIAGPVDKEQAVAEPVAKENNPAQEQAGNVSETYRMHRVRK